MNGGGPAVPANAGLAELGPNDCCGDGEVKEKDGDEVGCREATVVRKLNLFAVLELVAVGTAGCGVAVKGLGVGEGKDCRMPGAGAGRDCGLTENLGCSCNGSRDPPWRMEVPGLKWLLGGGRVGRLWGEGEGLKEEGGTAGVGWGMKELFGEIGRWLGTAGVGLPTEDLGLVKMFPLAGEKLGTAGVGWGMNGLGLVNRSLGVAVPLKVGGEGLAKPGLAVPRNPPDG